MDVAGGHTARDPAAGGTALPLPYGWRRVLSPPDLEYNLVSVPFQRIIVGKGECGPRGLGTSGAHRVRKADGKAIRSVR